MKQKIVIEVQMNCEKCRKKAKKIAATADGVISVALGGAAKDQIVVTGEEVDSAKLAISLRKKVGHANIMSVQEEKGEKKGEEKGEKKGEEENPNKCNCKQCFLTPCPVPYYYSQPLMCELVCDPDPNYPCTIM